MDLVLDKNHVLKCIECNIRMDPDFTIYSCKVCNGPLDIEYSHPVIGSFNSYNRESLGSLGEGQTPIVQLSKSASQFRVHSLYAKLEYFNPTASFKDRGSARLVQILKENGCVEFVEDSSGNAGASLAAYASRVGIKAHIFVSENAPKSKLLQIQSYGAIIHKICGSRNKVEREALSFVEKNNLIYASHSRSPYFLEGMKTFSYELINNFINLDKFPDHIVFPVGNGSLLIGVWKGLEELVALGELKKIPKLHCIQPELVMPVVNKFNNNEYIVSANETIASGASVEKPFRMNQIIDAIRCTDGGAIGVSEKDILNSYTHLSQVEGIFAEPTSALALAGTKLLVDSGVIAAADSVLIPITGIGLKQIELD